MTDLIELRKLAWKANMNMGWIGAGPTRHGGMISTSGKPLFIDSVYLDCDEEDVCDDNGYFVCSVNEHYYGEFIAAASPKVVLELLDRIDSLQAVCEQAAGAIEYLIERANDSDEVAYGTLSTSFVRDCIQDNLTAMRAVLEKK